MIFVAARHGYAGTSVDRVIKQAGVSRATFYECFRDKEDCFLAAYRGAADRVAHALQQIQVGREDGLRKILAQMLESADRDPGIARVVLIESLAGGAAVRAEHEQRIDAIEALVESGLDALPAAGLQIPARALLGGISGVMAIRIFRGDIGRLIELLDDLEAWADAYALPPGHRRLDRAGWSAVISEAVEPREPLPNPIDVSMPRGRAALPPAVASSEHRQRILAAVARVAREKGYAGMTVADVVSAAGLAREVFYDQFRNKENAFLAAQAHALETSVSLAASRFFSEDSWPDRVWSSVLVLLDYMASVPDLATLDLIESYAAGGAAIRRSFESRMAYTLFLEEGYRQRPEAERLPRLCSEAIAGAILELLRQQVLSGRVEMMRELAPHVTYVALAPFLGPAAALEHVEARLG